MSHLAQGVDDLLLSLLPVPREELLHLQEASFQSPLNLESMGSLAEACWLTLRLMSCQILDVLHGSHLAQGVNDLLLSLLLVPGEELLHLQ